MSKLKNSKQNENQENDFTNIEHSYKFEYFEKYSQRILKIKSKYYEFELYWYEDFFLQAKEIYFSNIKINKKFVKYFSLLMDKILQETIYQTKQRGFKRIDCICKNYSLEHNWLIDFGFRDSGLPYKNYSIIRYEI